MIDLATERVELLADIAGEFPRKRAGRKIHVKTIRRYIFSGLRGKKLEAVRGPSGALYTSREAVRRFLMAVSEDLSPSPVPVKSDAQLDLALRARGLA